MVPVFQIITLSNLMDKNGGPAFAIQRDIGIYPALTKVRIERTELMIKVILPADRSDDSLDRDLLYPQESSIRAFVRCIMRESCQLCGFTRSLILLSGRDIPKPLPG